MIVPLITSTVAPKGAEKLAVVGVTSVPPLVMISLLPGSSIRLAEASVQALMTKCDRVSHHRVSADRQCTNKCRHQQKRINDFFHEVF